MGTKKGGKRKGKLPGSRLAFDDTIQEKKKLKKKGGNRWIAHLKKFWNKNKGKMSYKQAMVEAKKSYKK